MNDPIVLARQIAFNILVRHPDCIRDDVSLNDLIDDIATAIVAAVIDGRGQGRAPHRIAAPPEGTGR